MGEMPGYCYPFPPWGAIEGGGPVCFQEELRRAPRANKKGAFPGNTRQMKILALKKEALSALGSPDP